MNHYWTADDHPAMRQAQIEDWLEDLAQFDMVDVKAACREWRRTHDRRPTPANIRIMTIAAQRERAPALLPKWARPPEPERPPLSEDERAYGEACFAKLRASLGALPSMLIARDDGVPLEQGMSQLTRELIQRGLEGRE
jgi:hypothetical protein